MMKRRQFQHLGLSFLAGLSTLGARAQESGHRELARPAPIDAAPPRIEVVDFFWYGCPHCNAFAPLLDPWIERLPADVAVRKVPVAFQPSFGVHQRLYFTLEAMGQVNAMHRRVFRAIHGERQRLNTDASILDWARRQPGLDGERFAQTYGSFSVAGKAARATQLQEAYGVNGVPALGVAGRYYTDASLAGDMARALQVVENLIGRERRAQRR
jgi:protein dithiol oxidoreductase (disulfide-forming)